MITFYDIPTANPNRAWSPNTWRTRLTLNYKGLPYTTKWVEYPDIKLNYLLLGAEAPAQNADGTPYYSLPLIADHENKQSVADSKDIAVYLDEAYPDTPRVFPGEGEEEKLARYETFYKEYQAVLGPFCPTAFKACVKIFNPESAAHFKIARAKNLAAVYPGLASLDDYSLSVEDEQKAWAELKKGFEELGERYFGGKDGLEWFEGGQPTFADFVAGGMFLWFRAVWGEDSEEWKGVKTWSGGKWAGLVEKLEPYTSEH